MTKNVLYVGNYLKGLQRNPSYMFTLGPLLEGLGFELFYASSKEPKLLRLGDMMYTFLKLRHKLDVVLIDTYSTQNFYYAVLMGRLCRRFRVPYIPILHGGELPMRLANSPKLSRALFSGAFKNVAPSGYLKQAFEHQGFSNVELISNVISVKKIPYSERTKASFTLLWVRRLQAIYNPMMALKVLQRLKQLGHEAELCMVGDDYDGIQSQLEAFAKDDGLQVHFTGSMSQEEWMRLSQEYDIFLNTSNVDNTPLSVIEAMALGLAVVSTNVGGIPNLIEDGVDGILVPPNNHEAMADAVIQIVEEIPAFLPRVAGKAGAGMTRKARAKVEQFDWQVVKHQWKALLDEVGS